ncbi:hypothetical protein MTO96_037711 [Rhipicephalus appendiculatus]
MDVADTKSNDAPDGHEDCDNVTHTPEAELDADGWMEVTRRKKIRQACRDDEPSLQRETHPFCRRGGVVHEILLTSKMSRLAKGDIR